MNNIEEAAKEYMNIPPVKAAIRCGDIEDLESHIKVAFKNGANWQKEKAIEALDTVLDNWVHGGDADYIIAEFEEKLNS